MPKTSSADAATHVTVDLIDALQNPVPASPFAKLGKNKIDALNELAEMFVDSLPKAPEAKLIYPTKPPQFLQTHPMRTRKYQPTDASDAQKDNPKPVPRVQ
eukprot:5777779-Ditylum_brightwellii.AAC.1